jgi:hypothetical protein
MKKFLLSVMENIGLVIGLIFFVSILDFIGLGGKGDFGAGWAFGFLVIIVVFALNYNGKWKKIIEWLKK